MPFAAVLHRLARRRRLSSPPVCLDGGRMRMSTSTPCSGITIQPSFFRVFPLHSVRPGAAPGYHLPGPYSPPCITVVPARQAGARPLRNAGSRRAYSASFGAALAAGGPSGSRTRITLGPRVPVCPGCHALLTSALPLCVVARTTARGGFATILARSRTQKSSKDPSRRFSVAQSCRDDLHAVGGLLNRKAVVARPGVEPGSPSGHAVE